MQIKSQTIRSPFTGKFDAAWYGRMKDNLISYSSKIDQTPQDLNTTVGDVFVSSEIVNGTTQPRKQGWVSVHRGSDEQGVYSIENSYFSSKDSTGPSIREHFRIEVLGEDSFIAHQQLDQNGDGEWDVSRATHVVNGRILN